jgi:hypothetical protein
LTVGLLVVAFVGLGFGQPASAAAPTVSDPIMVANPSAPLALAVASDDDGDQLVVYAAVNGQSSQILAALVSSNGSVQHLDLLSRDGDQGDSDPSVAFNGTFFFVTWTHPYSSTDHDIYGRVVLTDGTVADTVASIETSTDDQKDSSVATNGSSFVVTYADDRTGTFDVYSRNVSKTGRPVGPANPVATDTAHDEVAPDVAWNGSSYLVSYDVVVTALDHDVRARRVNTSGMAVGSTVQISNGSASEQNSAVASNGSEFFVVWQDGRTTGRGQGIYGARLDGAGAIKANSIVVSAAPGTESEPDVAWNGAYLVAWADERSGRSDDDIYAARVTASGTVQEPDGFAIAATSGTEVHPSIARAAGSTRWAVADVNYGANGGIELRTTPSSPK